MERRPTGIVLTAAGLTVAVLATCVYVGRDRLAERWLILQLRSANEATRIDAAEKLAAMRSVAAVPHIVRIVAEERRERITYWVGRETTYAYGLRGCTAIPGETRQGVGLTPMAHAIHSIGAEGLPALQAEIRALDAKPCSPGESSFGDFDLGPTLTQISWAIERKDQEIEKQDYESTR
jgi:hypothetical protein